MSIFLDPTFAFDARPVSTFVGDVIPLSPLMHCSRLRRAASVNSGGEMRYVLVRKSTISLLLSFRDFRISFSF